MPIRTLEEFHGSLGKAAFNVPSQPLLEEAQQEFIKQTYENCAKVFSQEPASMVPEKIECIVELLINYLTEKIDCEEDPNEKERNTQKKETIILKLQNYCQKIRSSYYKDVDLSIKKKQLEIWEEILYLLDHHKEMDTNKLLYAFNEIAVQSEHVCGAGIHGAQLDVIRAIQSTEGVIATLADFRERLITEYSAIYINRKRITASYHTHVPLFLRKHALTQLKFTVINANFTNTKDIHDTGETGAFINFTQEDSEHFIHYLMSRYHYTAIVDYALMTLLEKLKKVSFPAPKASLTESCDISLAAQIKLSSIMHEYLENEIITSVNDFFNDENYSLSNEMAQEIYGINQTTHNLRTWTEELLQKKGVLLPKLPFILDKYSDQLQTQPTDIKKKLFISYYRIHHDDFIIMCSEFFESTAQESKAFLSQLLITEFIKAPITISPDEMSVKASLQLLSNLLLNNHTSVDAFLLTITSCPLEHHEDLFHKIITSNETIVTKCQNNIIDKKSIILAQDGPCQPSVDIFFEKIELTKNLKIMWRILYYTHRLAKLTEKIQAKNAVSALTFHAYCILLDPFEKLCSELGWPAPSEKNECSKILELVRVNCTGLYYNKVKYKGKISPVEVASHLSKMLLIPELACLILSNRTFFIMLRDLNNGAYQHAIKAFFDNANENKTYKIFSKRTFEEKAVFFNCYTDQFGQRKITLLQALIEANVEPCIKRYLLEYPTGVTIPSGENSDTPLHTAIKLGRLGTICELLRCDAPIGKTNRQGISPLGLAMQIEDKDSRETFLSYLISKSFFTTKNMETLPLHEAMSVKGPPEYLGNNYEFPFIFKNYVGINHSTCQITTRQRLTNIFTLLPYAMIYNIISLDKMIKFVNNITINFCNLDDYSDTGLTKFYSQFEKRHGTLNKNLKLLLSESFYYTFISTPRLVEKHSDHVIAVANKLPEFLLWSDCDHTVNPVHEGTIHTKDIEKLDLIIQCLERDLKQKETSTPLYDAIKYYWSHLIKAHKINALGALLYKKHPIEYQTFKTEIVSYLIKLQDYKNLRYLVDSHHDCIDQIQLPIILETNDHLLIATIINKKIQMIELPMMTLPSENSYRPPLLTLREEKRHENIEIFLQKMLTLKSSQDQKGYFNAEKINDWIRFFNNNIEELVNYSNKAKAIFFAKKLNISAQIISSMFKNIDKKQPLSMFNFFFILLCQIYNKQITFNEVAQYITKLESNIDSCPVVSEKNSFPVEYYFLKYNLNPDEQSHNTSPKAIFIQMFSHIFWCNHEFLFDFIENFEQDPTASNQLFKEHMQWVDFQRIPTIFWETINEHGLFRKLNTDNKMVLLYGTATVPYALGKICLESTDKYKLSYSLIEHVIDFLRICYPGEKKSSCLRNENSLIYKLISQYITFAEKFVPCNYSTKDQNGNNLLSTDFINALKSAFAMPNKTNTENEFLLRLLHIFCTSFPKFEKFYSHDICATTESTALIHLIKALLQDTSILKEISNFLDKLSTIWDSDERRRLGMLFSFKTIDCCLTFIKSDKIHCDSSMASNYNNPKLNFPHQVDSLFYEYLKKEREKDNIIDLKNLDNVVPILFANKFYTQVSSSYFGPHSDFRKNLMLHFRELLIKTYINEDGKLDNSFQRNNADALMYYIRTYSGIGKGLMPPEILYAMRPILKKNFLFYVSLYAKGCTRQNTNNLPKTKTFKELPFYKKNPYSTPIFPEAGLWALLLCSLATLLPGVILLGHILAHIFSGQALFITAVLLLTVSAVALIACVGLCYARHRIKKLRSQYDWTASNNGWGPHSKADILTISELDMLLQQAPSQQPTHRPLLFTQKAKQHLSPEVSRRRINTHPH